MEATGRNHMLTARASCLAIGMLLLASCGSEPDRILPAFPIPEGTRAVSILIHQDISVVPGDHVDVLVIEKGQQSRIALQNVEVVTHDDNVVQFVVSPEDAQRVGQASERGPFQLRRN